jgi:hypothetical protein
MPTSSTGSGWLELKVCVLVLFVLFYNNSSRYLVYYQFASSSCTHDHAQAQVAGQAGIPTWKRVWIELKFDIRCAKVCCHVFMLEFPRVHSLHVIICIHGASFRKECLYIRYCTLMLRNCPLRASPRPAPPTPLALPSVRMTKLIARNLGLQILNQKAVFPRLSKACVIQSIIKNNTHLPKT